MHMLTFETVVHAGFLLKQTLKMVEMQLFLTWNVDEKQHMGHIYSNLPGVVYKRNISFVTSLFLVITTQVLRYGWAGLMRKYVVEPAHMWWPVSLVQVSLMGAMHEKEKRWMTRGKFFLIALICSFAWYTVPGYLFPTLTAVSWVRWVFPKSITMQQIGSSLNGLGIGAFTLDWSTVVSWLGSPLVTPFFATANVLVGYVLLVFIMLPVAY
ncbi:oligopeptide transporter 4-like [Hordeum vulgare subsp. vulgare]|uniref:oligopeptide transporter 4-like n=1 Tax=Hordeum vulgare subsp. vulgare TaxID=112509 RepID=UPI001D1A4B74|nr:oligopeptide transporter 4-like [Hordeum vulgare subsp. vulgare]XP_044952240.1 oligopeptide transporter 4-like [Hordeum vulgare subsp. vulgare]